MPFSILKKVLKTILVQTVQAGLKLSMLILTLSYRALPVLRPLLDRCLPKSLHKTVLDQAILDLYYLQKFEQLQQLAKQYKTYRTTLWAAHAHRFLEKSSDKDLMASGKALITCLKNEPDTFQISLKKSAPSEKVKVVHLVSGFAIESTCAFLLESFFQFSSQELFSHELFARNGCLETTKVFLEAHGCSFFTGNLETPLLAADIVMDWDGFSDKKDYIFPANQRPLIASFSNDFLPTGRQEVDAIFTFESAAPCPDEIKLWKEKACILPDKALLGLFNKEAICQETSLPFEKNGFLTFGVFAPTARVTDASVQMWAEILEEFPESRIGFCDPSYANPLYRRFILKKLHKAGIAETRVLFSPPLGNPAYWQEFEKYDIFLGAYPDIGGRTTLDMFSCGFFPLFLCKEDIVESRFVKSNFCAVGLSELVFKTPAEYVAFAKKLAHEPQLIDAFRSKVRQAVEDYRKNTPDYLTRCIEAHLLEMSGFKSPSVSATP